MLRVRADYFKSVLIMAHTTDPKPKTDSKKSKASAAANRATSPSIAVNHLDDLPHETFTKGVPMVDSPALTSCKWCKKSILMTTAVEHINGCLKIKKEKANRKKAAREARERAKEQAAREERERRAEEEGIPLGGDGDSGDDDDDEKVTGGKSTKKVAGKRAGDGDVRGKKRKADGDADKAPKQKKKKDEPKPKTKPKGELSRTLSACTKAHVWLLLLLFCLEAVPPFGFEYASKFCISS